MTQRPARYLRLIKDCRRRGCPPEIAKELVQEAHLRLFDYQRHAKVSDAATLLRRITINLAINYYNRVLSKGVKFESIEKLDRRGLLVHSDPGPERSLAAEQELEKVMNLLSAVSPRTCQIFIEQRAGYSYGEIGEAFAIKPRTVEKHVTTAVLMLEEMPSPSHSQRPGRTSTSTCASDPNTLW